MKINPTIFREYDIRGIAETDLPSPVVVTIGKALGTLFKNRNIKNCVIGRDCRLSSPRLFEALSQGILSTGIDVVSVDLVPTPALYFAIQELQAGAGIMITGSHNPGEYNGFKVGIGLATLYSQEIAEVLQICLSEKFHTGTGELSAVDIVERYTDAILKRIRHPIPRKVVIDCGNGMAGIVAPILFQKLGCEVISLFENPDGNFPNHHPDPTVAENLETLKQKVKESGAIVGIAFDGDADRIGLIDPSGRTIYGDDLLILYSRQVLIENPGATIISEVKASNRLYNDIQMNGGDPIMWKTGHSLIKAKMKETGALLAGEMSGHIFFKDRYFGFDDAIYAAARLMEIIHESNSSTAELLRDVPINPTTPEIRVDCPDEIKFQVVEKVKADLQNRAKDIGARVIGIDGARIEFSDGWGLIRASNTQPVLVFRFEAETVSRLDEIREIVESTVAKFVA